MGGAEKESVNFLLKNILRMKSVKAGLTVLNLLRVVKITTPDILKSAK